MNGIYRLCDIKCGEYCKVYELCAEEGISRRLQDLGFIRGTRIECLIKSPLGDPTAFLVRGAVIALRKDDSKHIKVEVI